MMKNKVLIIILSVSFLSYGQQSQKYSVEELTTSLNNTIAPNFQLELRGNKAFCNIVSLSEVLDLRVIQNIEKHSVSSLKKVSSKDKGRTAAVVYWMYDFQPSKSSKVVFRSTKRQQIFCKISFKVQDTIVVKSKLSGFGCVQNSSDATLHSVQWLGDKYISLLLTPKWFDDKIIMEVRGITVSGKFQRTDQKTIAKNYTKILRGILKREFKKLFESEDVMMLLKQK